MRRVTSLASIALRTCRTAPKVSVRAVQPTIFAFPTARAFASSASGPKLEPFLDPKEVAERIITVLKNFEKVNASKVSATAKFKEDLDLDSLDAVEVVMAIEEEFNIEIPDSEADKILSVPDAVAYISAHPMAK